ncbi:MAG: energy transducer TonB, partial [Acidobacteriota bacterium]|nr:energy transducer TonB [Acidobacteriota bacterium]
YIKALAELEQHRLHASAALAASGGALWHRTYRLAYRIEPIGRLPAWSALLALLAAVSATALLVHPQRTVEHTAMYTSAVARPMAVAAAPVPAVRNPQVPVLKHSAPGAAPPPTRIAPPAPDVQIALASAIALPPQAIAPLATWLPIQLAAISELAAPAILVVAPHPLSQPEYPYAALRDGLGGTVRISFRVGAGGQVADIRTQMISGPAILASTARAALENWQFQPVQINGKTVTPQVNLEFVFSTDPDPRAAGHCTMVTGSHVCHSYRISLRNLTPVESGGDSGVAANQGSLVKLAVVENAQGALCTLQDACFLAASQPGRGHEQRIRDEFRLLSQGFIPAGGSF